MHVSSRIRCDACNSMKNLHECYVKVQWDYPTEKYVSNHDSFHSKVKEKYNLESCYENLIYWQDTYCDLIAECIGYKAVQFRIDLFMKCTHTGTHKYPILDIGVSDGMKELNLYDVVMKDIVLVGLPTHHLPCNKNPS